VLILNAPFDQHSVHLTEETPGSYAGWRGLESYLARQLCAACRKILVGQKAEQAEALPALAQSRVYARLAVLTQGLGPQRLVHRLRRTSCLKEVVLLSLSLRSVNRPSAVFFSDSDPR
jgi:hypothetical protein